MLVMYDFASRNSKELAVRKGDVVEASIRKRNHISLLLNIVIFIVICSSSIHSC